MKKAIFKLHADCGRQGTLEGLFVSTKEKVDLLIKSGIEVYFGEVLGKHSEVYGSLTKDDITFISDSKEVVDVIEKYDLQNGYDPFDYETPEGESVDGVVDKMLKNRAKKKG